MASERAKQMQQANTLAEVLASLERIEIALGIKPKPEEVKEPVEEKPAEPTPVETTPPARVQGQTQGQGVVSRQSPRERLNK
jgi:hypothetical protein